MIKSTQIKFKPNILLTRGLPGAGKTTWANEMTTKHDVINVCLDDIRKMAGLTKYSKANERMAFDLSLGCIKTALDNNKNVIVSNTHLTPYRPSEIYKKFKHDAIFYIVDFLNVGADIASERNKLRIGTESYVPQEVIDRFATIEEKGRSNELWKKFQVISPDKADVILSAPKDKEIYYQFQPNLDLPSTVIVDIDGTLAQLGDRNPFDHTKYSEDLMHPGIARATIGFEKIILLTGRSEEHRSTTVNWLKKNNFTNYDKLFMRANDDRRPDFTYKLDVFVSKIMNNYNVQLVLEDRKQVVNMWRRMGLTCAQVAEGNF